MWVNREKWERLEKRISELESRATQSTSDAYFTVYDDPVPFPCWRQPYYISIKDVLQSILYKLGVELKYVKGQPERVAVQDVVRPS